MRSQAKTARGLRPDRPCLDKCLVGTAMEGMCVGLVLMNAAGRIHWINRAAQTILQVRPEDVEGRRLSMVIRDPRFTEWWHQAIQADENVLGEVTITVPRTAELKLNATRSLAPGGEVIGRVLLICDVTAEKAIQISLSRIAAEKIIDMAGQVRASPTEGLTPQEIRVLRLVGAGLGNQEIAKRMHVAVSTVRSHLKHVYRKMEFDSRSEAVAFAVQNHLV